MLVAAISMFVAALEPPKPAKLPQQASLVCCNAFRIDFQSSSLHSTELKWLANNNRKLAN